MSTIESAGTLAGYHTAIELPKRRLRGLRPPGVQPVRSQEPPEVTVVVPTRGEAGNVDELLIRLDRALGNTTFEVLFVDDSDDETPSAIRAAAARSSRTVRMLHREPGRRDGRLGGAVVAGFQLARAPWAVVIDGDLQHPPEVLPALLAARVGSDVDVVYGTRYVDSADAGGLSGVAREWVSRASTALTKLLFPQRLRGMTDPMSGLFAVRLGALDLPTLRPVGYKILLEILTSSTVRRTVGVPYSFQARHSGESKASLGEGARFLVQLVALRLGMSVGRLTQLAAFLTVGLSGVGVNTLALWLLTAAWQREPYLLASIVATNVAILWNFALSEAWVFRKLRKRSLMAGFTRFWLLGMTLLPLQLGLLAVLVEGIALDPVVANIFVLALVFILRYLLTSTWVYSRHGASASPAPKVDPPIGSVPSVFSRWMAIAAATITVVPTVFRHSGRPRSGQGSSGREPAESEPGRSSTCLVRFVRRHAVVIAILALTGLIIVLSHLWISVVLVGWTLSNLLMLTVSVLTMVRQLYAWQLPLRSTSIVDPVDAESPLESFTVIVPARHEGEVLAHTLRRIMETDYPHHLLQVIVAIADDDPETASVARTVEREYPSVIDVRIVELAGQNPTKPLSLQGVYEFATGTLVGIADAESILSDRLLSAVNTLAVRNEGISIFQGGVALMNTRSHSWKRPAGASSSRTLLDWLNRGTSWWRTHNCLEYYFWFRSRLHLSARNGFIPLGGNTLFVRRPVLQKLDGWKNLLTEDCDFGTRASVAGFKTMVFYHPDLVTREETPESLVSLVKQRTRWHGGFMQVLALPDWRRVPGLRAKALAFETLAGPLFAAYCGIALPVALALAFTLRAPVGLVILSVLPLMAAILTALVSAIGIGEFNRLYGYRRRRGEALLLIVTTPVYQLALSIAALRAIQRMLLRQNGWEKTTHIAAHMDMPMQFVGSRITSDPVLAS